MAFNKLAVAKSLAIHLALALPLATVKPTITSKKLVSAVVFKKEIAETSQANIKPTKTRTKIPKASAKKSATPAPVAEIINDNLAGSEFSEGAQGFGTEQGKIIFRPMPVLLSKEVNIPYPEKAKLLAIEGSVLLRLTISQEGKVIKADVVSGHFELRKAALKLADKLFFLPATDDQGLAQAALIEHEVVFRLRQT